MTKIKSYSELAGKQKSREDILNLIQNSPSLDRWNTFSNEDQERLLLYLEGKGGLQILNDKFFQHVFRPDDVPERMESLISAILGEKVKIVKVLSREGSSISEAGSQVIMDTIIKTEIGSIINVEMLQIGFYFPGERSSCYISDMIMRQYGAIRSKKGKKFRYSDMKPVTLIVIMEKFINRFCRVFR